MSGIHFKLHANKLHINRAFSKPKLFSGVFFQVLDNNVAFKWKQYVYDELLPSCGC